MIKKQKFKLKEAALEFKKMRFDMILHKDAEQKVIDLIKISNDEAKVRALYGNSHTGKSNFLKNFIKKHADVIDQHSGIKDIVLVRLSSGVTPKDFCEAILLQLGIKPKAGTKQPQLENQVIEVLKNIGIELLIIDETQHALPNKTNSKTTQKLADTIKNIVDESHVPILLCGISSISKLIENNFSRASEMQLEEEQLFNRTLPPIEFNTIELSDKDTMAAVMQGYTMIFDKLHRQYGISIIKMTSAKFQAAMWASSEGVIGRMALVLQWAIELADEGQQIDFSVLGKAHDAIATGGWDKSGINPFTCSEVDLNKRITAINKFSKRARLNALNKAKAKMKETA
ncbi:hypothetical protein CWB58_00465 [Pseudoalteromonas sp. S201]|uniref:TniB family NTP-binding protein n=1 Tax=Pseudoalteromonas sp. S201 TaxID=579519 RepID=UPI00110D1FAD|nr:TniB family NTP-binding protein [Pseudoalteromonas sp. S201]TMS95259.1 hypothetical protein CWB58_00465 [Pseudoalteromonas sp. S201]